MRSPTTDEVVLSIATVSSNTKELTANCIQSVIDNAPGAKYEIIVVDNGSTDGSAEVIQQGFPRVRLIKNARNLGLAQAGNQALGISRGRYFLLLNSDTVVRKGALEQMLRFLSNHPHAGAVTCKLLNSDGTIQYNMHRRFPTFLRLAFALVYERYPRFKTRWAREYLMLDADFGEIQRIEQAAGTCIMIRKRVLEYIGGLFDAERFPLYYSDVDLCYRLREKGFEVYLIPGATITHLKGASIRRVDYYYKTRELAISSLRFFKKHRKYLDYALAKVAYLLLFSGMALWAFLLYMRGSITEDVLREGLALPLSVLAEQRISL